MTIKAKIDIEDVIAIITFFVDAYIIFFVPYRMLAFNMDDELDSMYIELTILDWLTVAVLVCFILKCYVHKHKQKRTEAYLRSGAVTEIPVIKDSYPKISLIIDIITILPIAPITFALRYKYATYFYLLWLLYLYNIPSLIKGLSSTLKKHEIIRNVDALRLVWLFLLYCVLLHFFASVYLGIAISHIKSGEHDNWIEAQGFGVAGKDGSYVFSESPHYAYARSLYYTVITMITTGFGDIASVSVEETICTIFMMYIGFLVVITIVSTISTMVASLSARRNDHMKEMDQLNEYMKYRHLGVELQSKIRHFYEYMYQQTLGVDEDKFIGQLPLVLQTQVVGATGGNLLKDITFFKDKDAAFLNCLIENLQQEFYSPGDTILRTGESTTDITFLIRGEAEEYKNSQLQRIITTATAFYQYAPFMPQATSIELMLVARSYCNVSRLSRSGYDKAALTVGLSEEEKAKIAADAVKFKDTQKRLNKLLGEGDSLKLGQVYKGWKKIFLINSAFRSFNSIIGFFGSVYYILAVPIQFAYFYSNSNQSNYIALTVVNYLVDVFFIMDWVLRMFFYSYNDSGVAICDRKKIFNHYYHNDHIYLDVISCVPFDVFFFAWDYRIVSVIRFIKLCRCVTLPYYTNALLEFLRKFKIDITSTMEDFIIWMSVVFLEAHYVGCGWLFFGHYELNRFGFNKTLSDDWFSNDEKNPNLFIDHSLWGGFAGYIRSIYWAMVAVTTIGYGDIVPISIPETLYATFAVLIGGLMYPAIVGGVSSVIGQFGQTSKTFKHKIAVTRRYTVHKKLDKNLQDRILRYYDYIWSRQHGVDELSILLKLPKPFRIKVQDSINGKAFNTISFFKADACERQLLEEFFAVLIPVTYLPNDIIIDLFEIGKGFFYITRGTVKVEVNKEEIPEYDTAVSPNKRKKSRLSMHPNYEAIMRFRAESGDKLAHNSQLRKRVSSRDELATSVPPRPSLTVNILASTSGTISTSNNNLLPNALPSPSHTSTIVTPLLGNSAGANTSTPTIAANNNNNNNILSPSGITASTTATPTVVNSNLNPNKLGNDGIMSPSVAMAPQIKPFSPMPNKRNTMMNNTGGAGGNAIIESRKLSKAAMLREGQSAVPQINIQDVEFIVRDFLTAGQYFGENSFTRFNSRQRVSAISYCDCYLLPTDDTIDIVKKSQDTDTFLEIIRDDEISAARIDKNIRHNLSKYEKVKNAMDSEAKVTNKELSIKHLFHPESLLRRVWDTICLLCVIYNIFVIPYHIMLSASSYADFAAEWITDVYMMINLILNYNYFAFREEGDIVSDHKLIRKHAVRTVSFWVNFLAAIPFDLGVLVYIYSGVDDTSMQYVVLACLRLPKLLRYYDYGFYFGQLRHIAEQFTWFPENIPKVTQLLLAVLMLGHLFCSILLALGRYGNNWDYQMRRCDVFDRNDPPDPDMHNMNNYSYCMYHDTWLQSQIQNDQIPTDGGSGAIQYLRSLYWATTTLLAAVIGDMIPITDTETLVTLLILLIGVAVSGAIIGDVANIAADLGTESGAMRNKKDDLEKYLMALGINNEIKTKAMEYFDYVWDSSAGFDEKEILADLPETLRLEVNSLQQNYISGCAIFMQLPAPAIKELSSKLQSTIFCPDDYIYKQGKTCNSLYFIKKGEVRLLDGDIELASKKENDIFGENAVFYDLRARETAQSISYSELFYITRQDLDKVFKKFPDQVDELLDLLADLPSFDDYEEAKAVGKKKNNPLSTVKSMHKIDLPSKIQDMFKPHSKFLNIWYMIGLFFIVYYIFSIPFLISFYTEKELKNFSLIFPVVFLDVIAYFYWFIDIFLKYKYITFKHHGAIISDKKEIAEHYKKCNFYGDVISVIPLELFSLIDIRLYPFFRLLHMQKLLTANSYLDEASYILVSAFPKIFNNALLRLLRIFPIIVTVNHIFGCLFFFGHRFVVPDAKLTWAIRIGLASYNPETGSHNVMNEDVSPWLCYLKSFYYVLQILTSVGFGDIRPYTNVGVVYNIILAYIAACEMAAFIGMISAFLEEIDRNGIAKFQDDNDTIKIYMRNRQFPEMLQKSISYYYEQKFENQNSCVEPSCVQELPELLQCKISYHRLRTRIESIKVFHNLDNDALVYISHLFLLYYCRKDDCLYQKNDIGYEIYFLTKGQVELTGGEDKKSKTKVISPGEYFGDDILRDVKGKRVYNAWTVTECELLTITKQQILKVSEEFPEVTTSPLFRQIRSSKVSSHPISSSINHRGSSGTIEDSKTTFLPDLIAQDSPFKCFTGNRAQMLQERGSSEQSPIPEVPNSSMPTPLVDTGEEEHTLAINKPPSEKSARTVKKVDYLDPVKDDDEDEEGVENNNKAETPVVLDESVDKLEIEKTKVEEIKKEEEGEEKPAEENQAEAKEEKPAVEEEETKVEPVEPVVEEEKKEDDVKVENIEDEDVKDDNKEEEKKE